MSDQKKTWLGKAFAWVAELFMNNYENWLRKLWRNIADDLKPDLQNIVQIIERIKTFVDSPTVDLITFAIPGDKDDKAIAWLHVILGSILSELKLDGKQGSDYSKTDLQSLATRLTEEVTGMGFDQSSTTIKTAYWNLVKLAD